MRVWGRIGLLGRAPIAAVASDEGSGVAWMDLPEIKRVGRYVISVNFGGEVREC